MLVIVSVKVCLIVALEIFLTLQMLANLFKRLKPSFYTCLLYTRQSCSICCGSKTAHHVPLGSEPGTADVHACTVNQVFTSDWQSQSDYTESQMVVTIC